MSIAEWTGCFCCRCWYRNWRYLWWSSCSRCCWRDRAIGPKRDSLPFSARRATISPWATPSVRLINLHPSCVTWTSVLCNVICKWVWNRLRHPVRLLPPTTELAKLSNRVIEIFVVCVKVKVICLSFYANLSPKNNEKSRKSVVNVGRMATMAIRQSRRMENARFIQTKIEIWN